MNYEDRVTKEYVEGLLGSGVKVAYGSYVGDGAYTNVLTFPFPPKLVIIQSAQSVSFQYAVNLLTANSGDWYTYNNLTHIARYTVEGNTLTLTYDSGSGPIMNSVNQLYYWIVIH